jgi:hypothetical protein
MSADNNLKLTRAQKREILILREHGSIVTMARGHRHYLLCRMSAMGLLNQGSFGHENVFRLSPIGKNIVFRSDLKPKKQKQ